MFMLKIISWLSKNKITTELLEPIPQESWHTILSVPWELKKKNETMKYMFWYFLVSEETYSKRQVKYVLDKAKKCQQNLRQYIPNIHNSCVLLFGALLGHSILPE